MSDLRGRTALVTGASSGIGAELARGLARRGASLVLVARREDRLRALAEEIGGRHGVKVDVVPLSLSEPEGPPRLVARVRELGAQIDVLVNNAGVGVYGAFHEVPWERQRALLELDVVTPVHLVHLLLPEMRARGEGWILNVASIGAFLPTPGYATYAAAKSFVLSFSEALAWELRSTRVRVSALCPGVTESEFFDVSGQTRSLFQRATVMAAADVAESGLRALLAGRTSRVPGFLNAASMQSLRVVPRRVQTAVADWLMRFGAREGSA